MTYARVTRKDLPKEMKSKNGYTITDIEMLADSERAELIDGEMFMMAPPMTGHQQMLVKLIFEIETYIRKNKGNCKLLPAPFGVYIKADNRNYVEPDISVICDEDKLDEKGCHGAPDWIIEIVSPSSRKMDYIRKPRLYQEAGVQEYWIIDPQKETVTVYNANQWDIPICHSFSEWIQVGIYGNLYLTFDEFIKMKGNSPK